MVSAKFTKDTKLDDNNQLDSAVIDDTDKI
jgi:hypothetical protein